MSNAYYDSGEKRAAKVNDLFARVARRYDLINDLQSFGLHRLWKRRLVRLARVCPGDIALDVCCGTGDAAFRLAGAGAVVAGLDFSLPMLEVAARRQNARDGSGPSPVWLQADALRLPFATRTFDVVTISYGLRNLASWESGLVELWRVLKPGGRLLVLDFGKPGNFIWRALYFGYLRWAVPVFGRLFCGSGETHSYILESLRHYPAQKGINRRLVELKASEPRVINLLGGIMSINTGIKPESSKITCEDAPAGPHYGA